MTAIWIHTLKSIYDVDVADRAQKNGAELIAQRRCESHLVSEWTLRSILRQANV